MLKKFFYLLTVSSLIVSCNEIAEDKVDEIAEKYCGCFDSLNEDLSKPTKTILRKASKGASDEELAAEREKLSEKELEVFQDDIAEIQDIQNSDNQVNKCLIRIDKEVSKYRTKDEDKYYNELIKAMKSDKDCFIGAYFMKEGLATIKKNKKKKKKADDEDDTESEE